MRHNPFEIIPAETAPGAAALFTSVEQMVVDLARGERGNGLPSATAVGRFLDQIFGRRSVQPLANERLETLRTFVNVLDRCELGRDRVETATLALRSAGFGPRQEDWIRSTKAHCA